MSFYRCESCGQAYPEEGLAYRCPNCGGVYDLAADLRYDPGQVAPGLPRMWRYRHTFGLPLGAPVVTLGEGQTPMIEARLFGRQVAFKLEYLNPTGSFKDRGTAPLVSFLLARKVEQAVEDSSGNAGASFAAYAARAGIRAKVFVPDYASGPKRQQIEAYGAQLVRILGARSAAAEAVKRAAEEEGTVYASHAHLPHGLPGFATIAYELLEQLGEPPGTVILPVGHGSLMLGVARGFSALHRAGIIGSVPTMVGVQARACAPLWALFSMGPAGLGWMTEGQTLAEGVRVHKPVRGDALLSFVAEHGGRFVAVEEQDIARGQRQLAKLGFYVEPTSAIVWSALEQVSEEAADPIAVILTGTGLKALSLDA